MEQILDREVLPGCHPHYVIESAGVPLSCDQVHGEVCSRMRLQVSWGSPPRSEAFACVLPAKLHDEGPKL
jgi:hypothetical protein